MKEVEETLRETGFISGRMISWSKSGYMKKNPGNEVYFNARLCVLGDGVIWWGDLDITKDRELLNKISLDIGKKLYVLRESDAFDGVSDNLILTRAVAVIE